MRSADGGAVIFVDPPVARDDRALHAVDEDVVPESRDPRVVVPGSIAIVNGAFSVCRSGKLDELFRDMLGLWPRTRASVIAYFQSIKLTHLDQLSRKSY